MKMGLPELLLARTRDNMLPWAEQAALAEDTGLSPREIEETALEQGIMPVRYQRNLGAITIAEQLLLFKAKVAVIGCGGLGGYVIEELARLGVGSIIIWDNDTFEENNLNRQLLVQIQSLGQSKVKRAAERVKTVNPIVQVIGHSHLFRGMEDVPLLDGVQVTIDALDNIPARLALSKVCQELKIPLIHGAVDGWFGQVITQFPGESTVEQIYSRYIADQDRQAKPPALSFVPAVIASLEVAQASKVILGKGDLLRGKLLAVDLLAMEIVTLEMSPDN